MFNKIQSWLVVRKTLAFSGIEHKMQLFLLAGFMDHNLTLLALFPLPAYVRLA